MARNTTLALAVTIIVIVGAAAGIYMYLTKPQSGVEQFNESANLLGTPATKNYTLPLGPGSSIGMKMETLLYAGPPEEEANYTNRMVSNSTIVVKNYWKWPFINVTMIDETGNESNQTIAFTLIEIPKEILGDSRVTLPMAIPFINEGLCINLSLTSSGSSYYTYTGHAILYGYNVSVRVTYDAQGILLNATYNIRSVAPVKGNITNLTSTLERVNLTDNGDMNVDVAWPCKPPLAGDLWFVWEGVYRLDGCKLEEVTLNQFDSALKNKSIVFFLYKLCPHCLRDWPNITVALGNACKEQKVDIYLVIIGRFMNTTTYQYVHTIMTNNGLTGYPAIAYFEGGYARTKILGERTAQEIYEFIKTSGGGNK